MAKNLTVSFLTVKLATKLTVPILTINLMDNYTQTIIFITVFEFGQRLNSKRPQT